MELRFQRRAGEWIARQPDAKPGKKPKQLGNSVLPNSEAPTLAQLGIEKINASRWQKLAAVDAATEGAGVMTVAELGRSGQVSKHHVYLDDHGQAAREALANQGRPPDAPRGDDGRFRPVESEPQADNYKVAAWGTSADYTLARLRRDAPELERPSTW